MAWVNTKNNTYQQNPTNHYIISSCTNLGYDLPVRLTLGFFWVYTPDWPVICSTGWWLRAINKYKSTGIVTILIPMNYLVLHSIKIASYQPVHILCPSISGWYKMSCLIQGRLPWFHCDVVWPWVWFWVKTLNPSWVFTAMNQTWPTVAVSKSELGTSPYKNIDNPKTNTLW